MLLNGYKRAACLALTLILLASSALTAGCSNETPDSGRIQVMVTILPLVEFAEAVGGDRVNIRVMVPPGASPHTYEPSPSQMKAMETADVYIAVGSGIEFEISWLEKLLAFNRSIHLVDCSNSIKLIEAVEHDHEHEEGSHNDEDDEHHDALDPHIWMSLVNARIMAQNIYQGFITFDSDNQQYYRENLEAYMHKLDQLHQSVDQGFKDLERRVFMIQHPSMGYFARDYNLVQLAIEQEGKEPTLSGLASLIDQARHHEVRVIFVSPQFNPNYARSVATEIGGVVITLDGLAKNYHDNMTDIFNMMQQAMK